MDRPKRTLGEYVSGLTATVALITALFAGVAKLSNSLGELSNIIQKLPPAGFYLLLALLVTFGVYEVWIGLARRSRLLRPEALLLKADRIEHLVGRSEDIERLSKLCTDSIQTHLAGESGAGKSALVQAGLCPELRVHARLIPIYIDVWGQDWETGPWMALASALWEALTEQERKTLEFTEPSEPEQLVASIRHVAVMLGRVPLLIFDQFDDYQIRHLSQFLPGRRRTWLPVEKLVAMNSFWRDVKALVDNENVHCLFVTRTDTADGLESIRFVCPEVYRLDRLNMNFVQPLLTNLTHDVEGSDPVVFEPDRGWERLKNRLACDLGKDGAVLPIQMKIALQGLACLRGLTVRDYDRKGALRGLEAAHVERHVAGAARNFGLTKSQVRSLLVLMVNPEALKTVPRTMEELQRVIHSVDKNDPRRLAQTVQAVLEYMERREIVRKRLNPDTRRHVWLLDHDYLCRGVLEAEQKAGQWFVMAQDSYKAFQDAGSNLWLRWKSLLDPWHQIVLGWLRLLGRFRYGEIRHFAALSLLRFIPYLIVGGGIIFSYSEAGPYKAWRIIHTAQGKSGDGGRREALEYLNHKGIPLAEIDVSKANLSGVRLSGADLRGANLVETKLAGAILSQAKLDNANLSKVNLYDANLAGASIRKATISEAVLSKANLTKADLVDVNLSGTDLLDANFADTKLKGADLSKADLAYVNLTKLDLSYANLNHASLFSTNFSGATLYDTKLIGAKLNDANLTDAKLLNADLTDANLPGVNLTRADLTAAVFTDANLTDANLTGANLSGANLTNTDLTGANLRGANLWRIVGHKNIKSLKKVDIRGAKNLPEGFRERVEQYAADPNQSAVPNRRDE